MTGIYADTSAILDGTTINAADVKTPLDALDTALSQYLGGAGGRNATVGAATNLGSVLQVSADAANAIASNAYAQLTLTGQTNTARQLRLGYDTTANVGFLQAETAGSNYDEIRINPNGGVVKLGSSSVAITIVGALDHDGSTLGVFATTPTTKQTVTGSRGANAALASLLTALAAYGLITDSSS